MKEPKSTRLQWIDLTRAIAIFCVIFCHCTERTYSLKIGGVDQLGIGSQIVAFSCFTIGRLGVPLFFMISGYLLLNKTYNLNSCLRFWRRNFLYLLSVTVIWWLIYDIYLIATGKHTFNLLNILLDVTFLQPLDLGHAWYMPTILSLYLCVPLVANALNSVDARILKFPVAIYFAYLFAIPFLGNLLKAAGGGWM